MIGETRRFARVHDEYGCDVVYNDALHILSTWLNRLVARYDNDVTLPMTGD